MVQCRQYGLHGRTSLNLKRSVDRIIHVFIANDFLAYRYTSDVEDTAGSRFEARVQPQHTSHIYSPTINRFLQCYVAAWNKSASSKV